MFGLVNLFTRAHQGASLSPAARSILRLIDGAIITFAFSAAVAGLQQLALGNVNWQIVGFTALVAGGKSAVDALLKYVRAHKDNPLLAPLEPVLRQAQTSLAAAEQANDVKEPLEEPDFINTPLPATGLPAAAPDAATPAPAPGQ